MSYRLRAHLHAHSNSSPVGALGWVFESSLVVNFRVGCRPDFGQTWLAPNLAPNAQTCAMCEVGNGMSCNVLTRIFARLLPCAGLAKKGRVLPNMWEA